MIYALEKLQGKPAAILLTHGHYDHICAANELREHYGIPVYAAKAEEGLLADTYSNLSADWSGVPYTVKADVYLEDSAVFEAGGFSVKMLLTPGHTPGSCCYWIEDEGVCLSGDTVLRKLRQNRFAGRQYEQHAAEFKPSASSSSGQHRNLSGTRRSYRCRI
ncbi:MAG: MBL fold metallo-hydrolase [Blautia hansenii]